MSDVDEALVQGFRAVEDLEDTHLWPGQSSLDTIEDALTTAKSELTSLRQQLKAEQERREWTEQWYAERFQRLEDYAKEHGFWPDVASIVANGTVSAHEPPTYAQQLNIAKNRAAVLATQLEAAEREIDRLVNDEDGVLTLIASTGTDVAPGDDAESFYRAQLSGCIGAAARALAAYRPAREAAK